MTFSFDSLQPITLDAKPLFDEYFRKYPQRISDLSFTNLFCWQHSFHYRWGLYREHIVITFTFVDKGEKRRGFYQPIGPEPAETLAALSREIPSGSACCVDVRLADSLKTVGTIVRDRDNDDYLYDLASLRELRGEKYRAKRRFVQRCAEYNPSICTLTHESVQDFLALHNRWHSLLPWKDTPGVVDESRALIEALQHWDALRLTGVCVRINDEIAGFALGEPLNDTTFLEHFEKANREYVGIYPYTLHAFVNTIPSSYLFLNREQDLGIPGLRKSKESYHPISFVEKCIFRWGSESSQRSQ